MKTIKHVPVRREQNYTTTYLNYFLNRPNADSIDYQASHPLNEIVRHAFGIFFAHITFFSTHSYNPHNKE